MNLNEDLDRLIHQCDAMAAELKTMRTALEKAKRAWPDFQIRVGAEWYDKNDSTKVPPDAYIWCSDGLGVWLIHGRGEPIGEYATAVKFWTDAYIPAPPEFMTAQVGPRSTQETGRTNGS